MKESVYAILQQLHNETQKRAQALREDLGIITTLRTRLYNLPCEQTNCTDCPFNVGIPEEKCQKLHALAYEQLTKLQYTLEQEQRQNEEHKKNCQKILMEHCNVRWE